MRDTNLSDKAFTVLIISYNEEENMYRTLNALKGIDEVILIDSGSSDETQAIAQKFPNVKVYVRAFDNLMNQWNYGHTLASNDWILSLDADYVLPEDTVKELQTLDRNYVAYEARFRYCIYGKVVRSAILPSRILFYNRKRCHYAQDGHAQKLLVQGAVGKIHQFIYHDDRKNLERWLWSQNIYSTQELEKLNNTQTRICNIDRLRKYTALTPVIIFFYCLIVRGGILEGRKGLFYAMQRMYAELILSLKIVDQKIKNSANV